MFSQNTFRFLDELAANNNRAWFEANKKNYELLVREPALDFIEEMAPVLASFAPSFRAEPRKAGGSLMRVYRDTRFSRDKTPYKTNIGIQFRHLHRRAISRPDPPRGRRQVGPFLQHVRPQILQHEDQPGSPRLRAQQSPPPRGAGTTRRRRARGGGL